MKTFRSIFLSACILSRAGWGQATSDRVMAYNYQGLHFVKNSGQVQDQNGHQRTDIHYRLRINSCFNVFVGAGLIQYQWNNPVGVPSALQACRMHRMDVQLEGANRKASAVAEEKAVYHEQYHFFTYNTIAGIYEKITYKDIYPKIDWVVYLKDNIAIYHFIVHPGGHIDAIKVKYTGALSLKLNPDGSLTAVTAVGRITKQRPAISVGEIKLPSSFTLHGTTVGFRTAPYKGTFLISPVL